LGEILRFFDWILFKLKEQDLIEANQAILSIKSESANSDFNKGPNPEVET
jgi:hypothetical protein